MPAWLGAIAVVLLSLYLALFPMLAALAAAAGARRAPLALALAFAGCWIVAEWLRAWPFTGFAWNPLGVAWLGDFGVRRVCLVAGTRGAEPMACRGWSCCWPAACARWHWRSTGAAPR